MRRITKTRSKPIKSATGRIGSPEIMVIEENRRVVANMTRQGFSAREIAIRLGIAQRNVNRWRSILRTEGVIE